MRKHLLPLISIAWLIGTSGCSGAADATERPIVEAAADDKIELDLSALDANGLQGPPDGLRSMAYEFCIPAREDYRREVMSVDSSVKIYRQSPGRIRCGGDQYLCVGETHQPGYRNVLRELASLSYVERIVPAYFE